MLFKQVTPTQPFMLCISIPNITLTVEDTTEARTMRACEQFGIIIVVWHLPTVHYEVSEGLGAARLP